MVTEETPQIGGNHMTEKQRSDIIRFRKQGMSLAKVAETLGMSINTVKSVVYRNPGSTPADNGCLQCGKPVEQTAHRKKKKFCSDTCRMKWWNTHPEMVRRKAFYHFICAVCGKDFDSYGNAHRKYCCRACYYTARNMESSHD